MHKKLINLIFILLLFISLVSNVWINAKDEKAFAVTSSDSISNRIENGSFETSLIRDELKNKYAISNNIDLIRIPYWDFNNIESILTQKLLSKIKEDN